MEHGTSNDATERLFVRLADGRSFGPASVDVVVRWAREGRVPREAMIEGADGGAAIRAGEHPALRAILSAPPTVAGPVVAPPSGMSVIIPYKNGAALSAYYLGIFGLLAVLFMGAIGFSALAAARRGSGFGAAGLLGVGCLVIAVAVPGGALMLGIKGLAFAKRRPEARGRVHAWIGIVLGGFGVLVGLAICAGLIAARMMGWQP